MRIYQALEAKGWSDNVSGIYNYYNSQTEDGEVIIVETWGMKDDERDKFFKFLDAICEKDGNLEWQYADSVYIDYDDNCAYDIGYGELDVILLDGEVMGRRVIEDSTETDWWQELKDHYEDDFRVALPSWFPNGDLFADGYEEVSCEFENGWYGRVDNPEEISQKMHDNGYDHVVFQIKHVGQFAVDFCVWGKKDEV